MNSRYYTIAAALVALILGIAFGGLVFVIFRVFEFNFAAIVVTAITTVALFIGMMIGTTHEDNLH